MTNQLITTFKNLSNRSVVKTILLIVLPTVVLVLAALYGARFANLTNTINSDHLIYPPLLKGFSLHDLVALSDHANFLKFPLFFLQSILPYTFATVSFVNISLFLLTISLWAALLVYVFGKRYIPIIFIGLSAIIIGSALFNMELLGPAIRNIEYPIALAFIIAIAKLISAPKLKRNGLLLLIISTILYTVSVAGDSLLLYAVTVPLILSVLLFGYRTPKVKTKRVHTALLVLIGSTLSAFGIRWVVQATGFTLLDKNPADHLVTIPFDHLVPSITLSIKQLLDLFGANVFGQHIAIASSLPLINLLLLVTALIGLSLIIRNAFKNTQKQFTSPAQMVVLATLAFSFFATMVAYIYLDLVVTENNTESIVSAEQDRYLTLLPLIAIAGITYVFTLYPKKIYVVIASSLVAVAILLSFPSLHQKYTTGYAEYGQQMHRTLEQLSTVLKDNNVTLIGAGYWYAASTSFYTDNTPFVSMTECNHPAPGFNIRKSFYTPAGAVRTSALVIDRQGRDKPSWNCTDEQLSSLYGTPIKHVLVDGPNATTVDVLLYNYDLREKLIKP